jgi:hypothetical protein
MLFMSVNSDIPNDTSGAKIAHLSIAQEFTASF